MFDDTQIQQLLRDMSEAWNAGDATAFADVFTEDADYITWFGAHSSGRKAIEDSHRFLFDGPLKGTKLTGSADSSTNIRFLSPEVALVIAGGGMSNRENGSVVTFTAVKESDRWRFASFQNTLKQEIPGKSS